MKRKIFALLLSVSIVSISLISVSATAIDKSMNAAHSTTTIRATATYYTHEVGRWDFSNPQILTTGGKGGGAGKTGSPTTYQSGNEYWGRQKYVISATNDNYVTTSSTKTFQWVINGTTNTWVTSKCYVY